MPITAQQNTTDAFLVRAHMKRQTHSELGAFFGRASDASLAARGGKLGGMCVNLATSCGLERIDVKSLFNSLYP